MHPDDFSDDDMWPDLSDPADMWVEFAVKRGVARHAANSMSKSDLVKALMRLDSTLSE